MNTFNSNQGRGLINLYRSTSSGRSQNILCSQWQLDEISRASKILDSSSEVSEVFAKIHKNYVKKSAKKCLKHACNSIDTSMSQLDSVLRRFKRKSHMKDTLTEEELSLSNLINDDSLDSSTTTQSTPPTGARREFGDEELELCRFFSNSNATECRLSGKEMSSISLVGSNSSLDTYLKTYADRGEEGSSTAAATKVILEQCATIRPLLDYNLAALKWYTENNVIEQQKLETRLVWCPNLMYWLQTDRLCNELGAALRTKEAQ